MNAELIPLRGSTQSLVTFSDLSEGERGELEMRTVLIRNFLGIQPSEFLELTCIVSGWPRTWHCTTLEAHINGLRRAQQLPGFSAAYMLLNGPVDPALGARQPHAQWVRSKHRAQDTDILERRAIFVDIDPKRPAGISATNEEHELAREVAWKVRRWLGARLGRNCLGLGSSGNGFFVLVAVEPAPDPGGSTARLHRFLSLLERKFGTDRVSIDTSVANPGRLMCAPGTWKRKGISTPQRPHRMTTFTCCASSVERITLGAL